MLAVLAGILVARVLPFIYPLIFSRLLDFVLNPGPSTLRDGLNTWIMSVCTCGTSFIISMLAAVLFRRKRRAAA